MITGGRSYAAKGVRSPENMPTPPARMIRSRDAGISPGFLIGWSLSRSSSRALIYRGGTFVPAIDRGETILCWITPDDTLEARPRGYDPGAAVEPDETESSSLDATITGRSGIEEGRAGRVPLLLRAR